METIKEMWAIILHALHDITEWLQKHTWVGIGTAFSVAVSPFKELHLGFVPAEVTPYLQMWGSILALAISVWTLVPKVFKSCKDLIAWYKSLPKSSNDVDVD